MAADTEPAAEIESADRPSAWLLGLVNPVLVRILRLWFHGLVSNELLAISVIGRQTGSEYTLPVAYERLEDTVFVTSFGTNWCRNLRDGGQTVTLTLQGRRRTGHATVSTDNRAVAEYVH